MRQGITGVIGTFSHKPIEEIEKKVFFGCAVNISARTPMKYEGRDAVIISFDINDTRVFPSLLDNFREHRERYKLTMNVFVNTKKVNLDAFK